MAAKSREMTPEQIKIQDKLEKYYWTDVIRKIAKDWRLYVMLLPLLLVFLFWRYFPLYELRITSYNVCYTKLLRT